MTTETQTSFVVAKIDELEPAPRIAAPETPDDGRKRFDVRRNFDITGFGVPRSARRTGLPSSTSTTRPCSVRPAKKSSTS